MFKTPKIKSVPMATVVAGYFPKLASLRLLSG